MKRRTGQGEGDALAKRQKPQTASVQQTGGAHQTENQSGGDVAAIEMMGDPWPNLLVLESVLRLKEGAAGFPGASAHPSEQELDKKHVKFCVQDNKQVEERVGLVFAEPSGDYRRPVGFQMHWRRPAPAPRAQRSDPVPLTPPVPDLDRPDAPVPHVDSPTPSPPLIIFRPDAEDFWDPRTLDNGSFTADALRAKGFGNAFAVDVLHVQDGRLSERPPSRADQDRVTLEDRTAGRTEVAARNESVTVLEDAESDSSSWLAEVDQMDEENMGDWFGPDSDEEDLEESLAYHSDSDDFGASLVYTWEGDFFP